MSEVPRTGVLAQTRRRFAVAAWLGEWSRHGALALVAAGVVALLLRRFSDAPRSLAALAALLLLPAAGSAWWRARRRFVSAATVAAWLDVRGGADGRLVTAFERDQPIVAPPPELRLRLGLLARPLLPALAFLALALWIPLPAAAGGLELPQLQADQLDQLAEKLATLEETVQLDEGLRAELHERLERARERLDEGPLEGGALASSFEARDALEARLEQEAATAQQGIELAQAGLAADAMARALASDAPRAEELLAQTLADLAQAGLSDRLPDELKQQLAELGRLDPAQLDGTALPAGASIDSKRLAELAQSAQQLQQALGKQLAKLVRSGLIDLSQLKPFDGKQVVHECTEACSKEGGA